MALPDWAGRALKHARLVADASLGRGSATRAEAGAAEYVRRHLHGSGLHSVQTQNFRGLRSIWLFLALVFGLAIMGHLGLLLLTPAAGQAGAWGISTFFFGFAFFLVWRKFNFQNYPLRDYLPHGDSQNVICVVQPMGEITHKAVIFAHLDSHRAVIWYALDFLVQIYGFLAPVVLYGLLAAPMLYLLGMLTGLQVFFWLGAALGFLHFFGWFTGVTADLGVFSPGANDNASAVGTALAITEQLRENPLENTEVWCVFSGCEESGCDGARVFLEQYAGQLDGAFFLDLEMVGIGERLAYIRSEGVVRARRIEEKVERFVRETAGESGIEALALGAKGVFTEMGVVWSRGLNGACILTLRKDSALPPEWHRLTDVPTKLEAGAFQLALEFTQKLLHRLDRGDWQA